MAVHAILLMADIRRLHQLRLLELSRYFLEGSYVPSIPGVGFQPSTVWVWDFLAGFFVWFQGSWVSWGCETQPFVECSDGLCHCQLCKA